MYFYVYSYAILYYKVQLKAAHKMKLRKEAIQYVYTMANISIRDSKSPYEKFFGTPSPTTPETCVSFGRIGYVTYGHGHA
jgi:hypothetical protein